MASAEPANIKIGRYEVVRKLASGGMAELFLARFLGPGGFEKRCAIKRVLPRLARDEVFSRMLLNEAKVAALFDHPNLVQIFELGYDEDEQLFVAMELVNGLDLRELARLAAERGQRIPLELVTWVMIQALDGLAYAHGFADEEGAALNLVHRDVTPHNILVSWDGAVKLVDFGIAKAARVQDPSDGQMKGKLPYMSPEQAANEDLDPRTDLFSLGVCFYELLAGERPFDAATEVMTVKAILERPPPSLAVKCPEAPPDLVEVIERALQKHPADRFSSALGLRSALQDILRRAARPVDRHALAAYLGALREGRPERFDRSGTRIPRAASALGWTGPDPYARFVPAGAREGTEPAAPPPASGPDPRPPVDHAPAAPARAVHEEEDLDDRELVAAGLRRRTTPVLLGLFAALAVIAAGVSWWRHQGADGAPDRAAPGALAEAPSASAPSPDGAPTAAPRGAPARATMGAAPRRPDDAPDLDPSRAPRALEPAAPSAPSGAVGAPSSGEAKTTRPGDPRRDDPAEAAAPEVRASRPESSPGALLADADRAGAGASPSDESAKPRRARAEGTAPRPRRSRVAATSARSEPMKAGARTRRRGTLVLRSRPRGLAVRVGQRAAGTTPAELRLPAGRHQLVLSDPARGIERRLAVRVKPGARTTASVVLRPGRLRVLARPWGHVFVDGRRRGVTPLDLELFEGEHRIRLEGSNGATHMETVTVRPGQKSTIKAKL